MARKSIEVTIERPHVHGHVRNRLGAVEEHGHAEAMGQANDIPNRIDGSERVRHVHDGDDPCSLGEQSFVFVHSELAGVGDRNHAESRAGLLAQDLPRHDVRVVLHGRDEDLVPGPQTGAYVRGCD